MEVGTGAQVQWLDVFQDILFQQHLLLYEFKTYTFSTVIFFTVETVLKRKNRLLMSQNVDREEAKLQRFTLNNVNRPCISKPW